MKTIYKGDALTGEGYGSNIKIPPWTYSKITLFDQCPSKYNHLYVLKDIKEEEKEHLIYGNYVHKALEEYIDKGKPLPLDLKKYQPVMDSVFNIHGDKFAEHRVGLKIVEGKLVSCDFFDPDVWFRGIVDLLVLDIGRAHIFDWKTGKNSKYADDLQLKLMAAAVFIRFPKLKVIKAGLVFLVADEVIRREYLFNDRLKVFAELDDLIKRREKAYETGVFNAKPNFTCKGWCPVTECKHFEERR